MPKIVDHDARRRELTDALLAVAARDGFASVSFRSVAHESGWSIGALRHYLPTRRHLIDTALEVSSERVAARLRPRIEGLSRCEEAEVIERACGLLAELLPLDQQRRDEMAVWLTLTGQTEDPAASRWRRAWFDGIREQCRRVIERLRPRPEPEDELRVAGLHAALDGLAVHSFSEDDVDGPSVEATLERLLRDLDARPSAGPPSDP